MSLFRRKNVSAWDLSVKGKIHLESLDDSARDTLPILMRDNARRNADAIPGGGATYVYISAEDNDRIRERFHTHIPEELGEPFADLMVFHLDEYPDIDWRVSKFRYVDENHIDRQRDIVDCIYDIFDRIDAEAEPVIVIIDDLPRFMRALGYKHNLRMEGHKLVDMFHNDTGIPVITVSRVPKHPLYYGAPFLKDSIIVRDKTDDDEHCPFTFLW